MSSFLMIAVVLINVAILVLGLISAGVEMYVSYFSKSRTGHRSARAGTDSGAGPVAALTRKRGAAAAHSQIAWHL